MSLVFYPEPHVYELDGTRVPSVTGILQAAGLIDFSKIPPTYLAQAQQRGTIIHAALHYYNEHDLDVARFNEEFPDYSGYLQAWITFCEQRHFTPVLNERRVASRRLRIAGTLDCLGYLDGLPVLLDFATGRPEDVAKDLQTAAYRALVTEWAGEDDALAEFLQTLKAPIRRYAVSLRRDATFRVEPYSEVTDYREFCTLVEAHRVVEKRRGSWITLAEVA